MDAFVGKVLRGRAAPSHESNLVPNKTWSRGEVQEVVWKTFQKAVSLKSLNSECVCMCVCGCSCHACRCSFQFNCLRLMAWVLRCHSNRRLMWNATVRVPSQSPSKSNALHVQEINGSTADILLELYDDQRKILGQNDTWAGSIDSCRLYSCALQLCRGNTTSLQPRWRFWPRPWKITEIWK